MTLRESLNERHHKELMFLKAIWLPEHNGRLDRRELTDRLEQAMLSLDSLKRMIDELSEEERAVLRNLLRSERFSAESSRLRAGESRGEWPAWRTTELLLSVERKGLVSMAKEVDWWQKKWYSARVPLDLARLLSRLWGIDNRVRAQVLSLHYYLASLPTRRVNEIAATAGASALNRAMLLDQLTRTLAHAAQVEARLASLPDERLRRAAKTVLNSHGGLLLLSRFDRETRHLIEVHKHDWRILLEDALIGTIGPVSLVDFGLGVEGEHLVIFLENVDGYFCTSQIPEYLLTPPPAEAVDFIIDLSSIVCFARHREARMTRNATVYKSTAAKLIAQCLMRQHVAFDPGELLDLKVRLCLDMGLLTVDKQRRLAVGPSAATWEACSLRQKLGLIYRHIAHLNGIRRGDRCLQAVQKGLIELLPSLDHGGWRPRHGLVMRAAARYIIDNLDEPRNHRFNDHNTSHREHNYRTLDQLRRTLENDIVRPLAAARIIEYGSKGTRPYAMRLSPTGRLLLDLPAKRAGAKPRVITTPDFEVLLFPEGDYYEVKHQLAAFCKPVKTEQVFHFKIMRQRVEHAVASGLSSDDILDILRRHSDNELPQNVAYSIKDWAQSAGQG